MPLPPPSLPPPTSKHPSRRHDASLPGRAPWAHRDVPMQDNEFKPETVTIAAGSTIRWTNHDKVQHTSTSDTKVWDSGMIAPGA